MRIHTLPTLLDRFMAEVEPAAAVQRLRPRLDVVEFADRFEVAADLPGLSSEDVKVEYHDGLLELSGERRLRAPEGAARVLRRERPVGAFRHSLAVGDEIEVEGIEASFRDGVLHVRLPKSDKLLPRQIAVSVH